MAYIVNTTQTAEATGATYTVSLGAHRSGDLLLCLLTQDVGTSAITAPAGWTMLGTQAASGGSRSAWGYKIAASSAESNPVFSGTTDEWLGVCLVIRDADQTNPFGATPTSGTDFVRTDFASGSSFNSGALTTGAADVLLIYSWSNDFSDYLICKHDQLMSASLQVGAQIGAVVGYWQMDASGAAAPTVTCYRSASAGRGGNGWVIGVRNASGGARQPCLVTDSPVINWYGSMNNTHLIPTWQNAGSFTQQTAGSFVTGKSYIMASVGTTDFTACGATSGAVTFQDTGDTVTLNSHGLVTGDTVYFSSITSTTGISTNTLYYVVNPTTNTFQVASTGGGTALALTTNGSGTVVYGVFTATGAGTGTGTASMYIGGIKPWVGTAPSISLNTNIGTTPWSNATGIATSETSTGHWVGGSHTITSVSMTGRVVSFEYTVATPITSAWIGTSGFIFGISDGTNWAVYQFLTKAYGWTNGIPERFSIDLSTATPLDSYGSINLGAVTRVAYLMHRVASSGHTNYLKNLTITNPTTIFGGGENYPANFSDYARQMNSWGWYQMARLQGRAQTLALSSINIGNGGTNDVYFDGAASSLEYPLTYSFIRDSDKQGYWNGAANALTLSVYGGSTDSIRMAAGIAVAGVEQNFTINASSSTSGTYSFVGTSLVGWLPTWKTGIACSNATFSECDEVAFKGAVVTDTTVKKTTSTDAACSFDTNSSMERCTIDVTDSSAAYHLELGASVTAMTLTDVTFTGTPGADKVHVLATTGTVTITIDGTTTLVAGDVTSAGATVSIVAPATERGQNFTGLVAGSFVRVVTSDNVTQKFEDTNSSTTETWDDATSGTVSVDYTIMKAGLVPIRVPSISLTGAVGTGVVDTPVDQDVDRGYATSSGLTHNTNWFANTGTKKLGLTTASTTGNFHSYGIEQWIAQGNTGEAFANTDFFGYSTGNTSYTFVDGWQFDLTTYPNSISNLSRGGLRYLDASENVTDVWAAILTTGVPAGLTVRYKHQSTGAWSDASGTGNMDELIKVIEDPNGDGSYADGFDRSGAMIVRVQGEGYDMAEVDVVDTFGVLDNYLYSIAPVPSANGIATGNPTLNGSPTISVGTYVESGKTFGIKIVDGAGGNSGTDLMRWIRYAQGQGGTFQGREANDWHDLIQTNGDDFKTVVGTIYGPTATKGVVVYQNDGVTLHPDFTLFTADDGTTYAPPVTADISITGMPDAVGAYNRLQIINASALTASAWQATTAYSVGAIRLRTSGIGTENTAGLYLRCTTAGTSAGVEPTWNTTPGGTTTDGTAVWTTYKVLYYDADPASTSYTATYNDGEEFLAGETAEIRFAEMNAGTSFKTYDTTTIVATTGFSASVAEEADDVYASNALDGSSYEGTFSPNFTNDYIVLDANTDFSGKSAYAYFCYTLTTSNGMYEFWGGVTALDTGNYRIETDILDLYFDESAGFVKQTDDVRIFRKDGLRPALDPTTGGYGIEINWRTPVSVVSTGGSALTPTESAYLLSLPTSSDNATAVLSAASTTPIAANIKKVADTSVSGSGTANDPWGP